MLNHLLHWLQGDRGLTNNEISDCRDIGIMEVVFWLFLAGLEN